MSPLELVHLSPLMERTGGRADIRVAVIDGPVVATHPDLAAARIFELPGGPGSICARVDSAACRHGTFIAGILCAQRGSTAPAICPNCTLLVRPVFLETTGTEVELPSATAEELAAAITEAVQAGAHVVNMSAALVRPSARGERVVEEALDYAAHCGVLAVAAAGNQASIGSSAITRHPWVIPVAGCDGDGTPTPETNLGSSIAKRGLRAPAKDVTSLGADGNAQSFDGTSAATPFVTGTIALLLSEFPKASAAQIKWSVTHAGGLVRRAIVPPLLDAWTSYRMMAGT
jgi:subtilisin family serine protease